MQNRSIMKSHQKGLIQSQIIVKLNRQQKCYFDDNQKQILTIYQKIYTFVTRIQHL